MMSSGNAHEPLATDVEEECNSQDEVQEDSHDVEIWLLQARIAALEADISNVSGEPTIHHVDSMPRGISDESTGQPRPTGRVSIGGPFYPSWQMHPSVFQQAQAQGGFSFQGASPAQQIPPLDLGENAVHETVAPHVSVSIAPSPAFPS